MSSRRIGTIILHKGQSFSLGQPGMKWVRKTTNIFLNLENSNKSKSSVCKILTRDRALTSEIINDLEFYSILF